MYQPARPGQETPGPELAEDLAPEGAGAGQNRGRPKVVIRNFAIWARVTGDNGQ